MQYIVCLDFEIPDEEVTFDTIPETVRKIAAALEDGGPQSRRGYMAIREDREKVLAVFSQTEDEERD